MRSLKAGDFIEAQVESLVLPAVAAEYYGGDGDLRRLLQEADAAQAVAAAAGAETPSGESPRLRSHWRSLRTVPRDLGVWRRAAGWPRS